MRLYFPKSLKLGLSDILEAVRWAPSAANMQPRRVVKDGDKCRFMSVTDGKLTLSDPGIAVGEDMEYIATAYI